MGSTRYPERYIPWNSQDADSIRACISMSCANPYTIPDLYVSTLGLSVMPGVLYAHADWIVLNHPLCREDVVRVSAGTSISSLSYVGMCYEMARVRITGYPGSVSGALSFHAGLCLWSGVVIEGEIPADVFNGGSVTGSSFKILIRTEEIDLLLNIDEDLISAAGERIGTAVRFSDRMTMYGGYRSAARSITAGLMIRGGNILTVFSWEGHPTLGSTYSAGIVRMW